MTNPVGPFYVVETTLNPGVFYNVGQGEMERLLELGVLIGGAPAPATVMDSQLSDLINDVNSLVHAAVAAFPPGPHTHPSTDLTDSGSIGRSLIAATTALGGRTTLGLDQVNNTSDANKPVSTAQQTALNLKANLASPTFTGTVGGITKAMVGLGSVDNTTDAAKPVSTAQQTALNLKANAANPVFTGTVGIPDGALAIADTAGLQTAIDGKAASVHTHATTDITNLTEAVQDIVAAFVVAGTGVTVTYDDVANTYTINASGGGTGTTDAEIVRDTIGAALVAGAGVQITVNDVGDTITIASTAVLPTRQVISGTGLAGGGDLSVDRTLTVAYGTTAGTAVQGNDARVVADQVATTASIRTLGSGAAQAAPGNHTHAGLSAASEAASGIVELATAAETTTGTDNTRAVHPAGLKVELDKKAPLTGVAGYKLHDGTATGGTRPTGYARIIWVSPTGRVDPRPTNMLANDAWERDA